MFANWDWLSFVVGILAGLGLIIIGIVFWDD